MSLALDALREGRYGRVVYPIFSSMLMSLFEGAQAKHRAPHTSVDVTIRRVAAGVWREVGASHGLELEADPDLVLSGTVRGAACEITLVGMGTETFTLARSKHDRSLGGRLVLAPASLARSVAAAVMWSRVRTGDREIDESFVVVSRPASLAEVFLGDEVRAALLAMRTRNPHLAIRGDTITLELEGTEMVHENLHAIVSLLSCAPREGMAAPYRAPAA